MGRLFTKAGLTDVQVESLPIVLRDPTALDNALGLRDWASVAYQQRVVAADEVSAWENALDDAVANNCFLYSFCLFVTSGRHRRVGVSR
jgi:hypothetical protein